MPGVGLSRRDLERLYEQAMEQASVWAEKHAKEFVRAEKAEARVEQLESFLNSFEGGFEMTHDQAQQHAVHLWGSPAEVWKDAHSNLHFVKADRSPKTVGDPSVPMGCGLSFEQAFENAWPEVARLAKHAEERVKDMFPEASIVEGKLYLKAAGRCWLRDTNWEEVAQALGV